jgi:hypothetical protein
MIHDFRMIVGFGLDARDEAEIQLRLAPGRRRQEHQQQKLFAKSGCKHVYPLPHFLIQ